MRIGFIGYGNMAAALAGRWLGDHAIAIGGRDPARAQALAERLGHGARSAAMPEVVADSEVVVLATPHEAVFDAIEAAGGAEAFAGRTVIDINNPVSGAMQGDFLPRTYDGAALAEAIQSTLPEARVVKAFNMCQARVWQMAPPLFDGRPLATLFCGDDAASKATVAGLIRAIGAEPVDVGELAYARLLEPAAAIVIRFLFAGRDPHTVLNLIQPERQPIG